MGSAKRKSLISAFFFDNLLYLCREKFVIEDKQHCHSQTHHNNNEKIFL